MRALALLILAASPAYAQQQCSGITDALASLSARYGETVRVDALMTGGQIMVITASPTGSWTALIVTPDGQACMVAAGEALEVHAPEPAGEDS